MKYIISIIVLISLVGCKDCIPKTDNNQMHTYFLECLEKGKISNGGHDNSYDFVNSCKEASQSMATSMVCHD